jgi:hypothetical protein
MKATAKAVPELLVVRHLVEEASVELRLEKASVQEGDRSHGSGSPSSACNERESSSCSHAGGVL